MVGADVGCQDRELYHNRSCRRSSGSIRHVCFDIHRCITEHGCNDLQVVHLDWYNLDGLEEEVVHSLLFEYAFYHFLFVTNLRDPANAEHGLNFGRRLVKI